MNEKQTYCEELVHKVEGTVTDWKLCYPVNIDVIGEFIVKYNSIRLTNMTGRGGRN